MPAVGEPSAFDFAISGEMAVSNCNSPSIWISGFFDFTIFVAAITLETLEWFALPFVENDNIATRGSACSRFLHESAAITAIEASSSSVGSMTSPQSE